MTRVFVIGTALFLCACAPSGSDKKGSDLQASCEALVSAETGVASGDVQTTSTQSEATGTVVSVSVAGAEAPWICRADVTGVITDVEYSQEG